MIDLSKKYTWYPKDWASSRRVFNLNLQQRGLYRELIDQAYANRNRIPVDVQLWARFYNSTITEIQSILDELEVKGLVVQKGEYIHLPEVEQRFVAIENSRKNGIKGGNPKLVKGGVNPRGYPQYKDKDKDKDKERSKVPTWEQFKSYALSKEPNVNIKKLQHKYEAWKEAGWRAGKDLKKIKVWKTTLLHTLQYITDEQERKRLF